MKIFETQLSEDNIDTISKVLRSGEIGFGKNSSVLENKFRLFSKCEFNISTNSASAAAFLIFAHLKEKYGCCDIYTPSLGFTSPAWAAKHHGHNLFFVDVTKDLLFDSEDYLARRKDSSNQVVLMPVLYGGVSKIPNFSVIGDEIIVVDSAHCATPTINFDFAFFSFHPYKPICSSDGGMISTSDKEADIFFRSYRNFGRLNNENGYDINQNGFKFYMNNLNATLALESIKSYSENLKKRINNYEKIKSNLNEKITDHDKKSSYYFATALPSESNLKKIQSQYPTSKHYPLMHLTSYYSSQVKTQKLKNTELLYPKIVNIPLYK